MSDWADWNRRRWNEITEIHVRSPFYGVTEFLRGASTLRSVEQGALGDVRERSLLHLQCHFGLDTLSLARLGARVTGVDFSERAIGWAERLRDEAGLQARFVCADLYELDEALDETFDLVFTSYGVLCWLPDLARWAAIIARRLKPGGRFVLVEHHPITNVYDVNAEGQLVRAYPYFNAEPIACESDRSYADADTPVQNTKTFQWDHTLADVINALAGAGLRIEALKEYPFMDYERFPGWMVRDDEGWWHLRERPFLPLLFSVEAVHQDGPPRGAR
ncbi:MAG: class I SAM-dependent methyltransferase [Alicyclobacillus sp.]|nr:class I SAM-dependent methyltransferase [Alicyclobacillus sp.]